MSSNNVETFDHAVRTAQAWIAEVARRLGTDDRHSAHRILRAWLHTLRDRLPVSAAADFAAQLPLLLRGAFYDGWQPGRTPDKYGPDEYRQRFAHETQIPFDQVDATSAAVTDALRACLAAGEMDGTLRLLPGPVRRILQGSPPADVTVLPADAVPDAATAPEAEAEGRLARLEDQVANVAEAVRLLARGLEYLPTDGNNAERASQAGSRAHDLIIATLHRR